MNSIHGQHLILGGGLLGLALADHLLRRGAEGVVVMESGSAPSRCGLDEMALVLRTELEGYRALEDRSLLLLEEWPSYLEVDPDYRRCGSLVVTDGKVDVPRTERLTAADAMARQPLVALTGEDRARFQPDDGYLDTTQLLSTLHWQVRRRGGRVIFDCEVDDIRDRGEHFEYRAGHRRGDTRFVYFTGDPRHLRFMQACGVPLHLEYVTWHRFQLETDVVGGCAVRLEIETPAKSPGRDSAGSVLEIEFEPEPSPKRSVIIVDTHRRERFLYLEGDPTSPEDAGSITVDWSVLEALRKLPTSRVPDLRQAVVRRGSADTITRLCREAPGVFANSTRRAFSAGSFGRSLVLLSLAVAELIAKETTPGPIHPQVQ